MNGKKPALISIEQEKLTPGELFRKEHGYSRTMSKLMNKYNCSTVEEYRKIRKSRRV
jgi:hypothetical protein